MNTLDNTVISNIELLLNLKEDDVLVATKYGLQKQSDFVQVDNTVELESAIYFTFSQIFLYLRENKFGRLQKTIKDIDIMIDNIYGNTQLNDLMEVEEKIFKEIIESIDQYYDTNIKERLFYDSPFFYLIEKMDYYYHNLITIFNENNEYVSKIMGVYKQFRSQSHGLELSFTSSEEEEKEEEEKEEEEKGEEEEEEEEKDKNQ